MIIAEPFLINIVVITALQTFIVMGDYAVYRSPLSELFLHKICPLVKIVKGLVC